MVTEAQFQRQVTDLAKLRGWQWVHFRPARRSNGDWYTPVEGPLGAGWPDLVLVRRHEIRFVELKTDKNAPTAAQAMVLSVLEEASAGWCWDCHQDVQTFVWRPKDWPEIEKELK